MTVSDGHIVLRATEALNEAAETGELRSMIETWLDPEFEYLPPPGVPEPGPYRGHDEMEAFYSYFRDQFDRIRISVEDAIEGFEISSTRGFLLRRKVRVLKTRKSVRNLALANTRILDAPTQGRGQPLAHETPA